MRRVCYRIRSVTVRVFIRNSHGTDVKVQCMQLYGCRISCSLRVKIDEHNADEPNFTSSEEFHLEMRHHVGHVCVQMTNMLNRAQN